MTPKQPKTNCIMCKRVTDYFTYRDGKVTGFNMGMCPECVKKLKQGVLPTDEKVTEK